MDVSGSLVRLAAAAWFMCGVGSAHAASAEKGKKLYVQHGCWGCHGFSGHGGLAGPRLAPNPMPADAFKNFVRNTNRAMPPYREAILSNADLDDIYAFVASIPKSLDVKSIRLLDD